MSQIEKIPGLFYDKGGAVYNGKHPDFGIVADGSTDDTAAVQELFDVAKADVGRVLLPAGDILITSKIDVTDVRGLVIQGAGGQFGPNGTRIVADFASADDLFDVSNTGKCRWSDFHIQADNVHACFYSENNSEAGITPSANIYENIRIQSTGSGYDRGWEFSDAGTSGNQNNDLNVFRDCHCQTPTEEGWLIDHDQSKTHGFYHCSTSGGKHIIRCSGSFQFYGGAGGGATSAAAFLLEAVSDLIVIDGANLETADRLFESSGPSASTQPVTIRNCRFATDGLNADKKVIIYKHAGPLIVEGNLFSNNSDVLITLDYNGDVGSRARIAHNGFQGNTKDEPPWDFKAPKASNNFDIYGNTFHAASTAAEEIGPIADGDATPSVLGQRTFVTANTEATTITGFDNAFQGQRITVIFGDSDTTVDFTGTNLKGNGGADWSPDEGDHMTGVFDGTDWYFDVSDNTA